MTTVEPALADWQYTKWGMTVDQVIVASNGQMARCPRVCGKEGETETSLATGAYKSGKFDFTAFANFDNRTGELTSVKLYLKDPAQGLISLVN
jgi:hypothetical protein